MKKPDLQKVKIESFKDLSEKIGILDLKTLDNKVIEKHEIVKEENTIIRNKYTKLLDKKNFYKITKFEQEIYLNDHQTSF
jgi:hypothetical protein